MNKLKATIKIKCFTCLSSLKRVKTFKVNSTDKLEANKEAEEKINTWISSLEGHNCKVCQSIINDALA